MLQDMRDAATAPAGTFTTVRKSAPAWQPGTRVGASVCWSMM